MSLCVKQYGDQDQVNQAKLSGLREKYLSLKLLLMLDLMKIMVFFLSYEYKLENFFRSFVTL